MTQPLIQTIKSDLGVARAAGNKPAVSLLSTLYGESVRIGKDNGNRPTNDTEVVGLVGKFIKNINETLAYVQTSTQRETLVQELVLLERYLPKQLTSQEIDDIIAKEVANGVSGVGPLMKVFKERYNGQYDGQVVAGKIKAMVGAA